MQNYDELKKEEVEFPLSLYILRDASNELSDQKVHRNTARPNFGFFPVD